VIAVEDWHRGKVEDGTAARCQHAVHLLDGPPLVVFVERVEDVDRNGDVEAGVAERQARDRRANRAGEPRRTREGQAVGAQVDGRYRSEPAEQRKVHPGAAAAVEKPRVGARRARLREQRNKEAPQAAEPEMPRFDPMSRRQQAIHASPGLYSLSLRLCWLGPSRSVV
jgi:hypothetical protein